MNEAAPPVGQWTPFSGQLDPDDDLSIPTGMVVCPACNGSSESEHWTTCGLCERHVKNDPRMNKTIRWHTYCPEDEALSFLEDEVARWAGLLEAYRA